MVIIANDITRGLIPLHTKMPYDVSGWIEVLWEWTLKEPKQEWSGVINLHRFSLNGDLVSNLLFGLAKSPLENAYFVNREIPQDCSDYVADEVARNKEFIAKYGEGDFGHTYALWSEILECLGEIEEAEYFSSNWKVIFAMTHELCKEGFKAEWIRFVVWGNW